MKKELSELNCLNAIKKYENETNSYMNGKDYDCDIFNWSEYKAKD